MNPRAPNHGASLRQFVVCVACLCAAGCAFAKEPEIVTFVTTDKAHIQGALFEAPGDRAVIFAHGAVFDKESWYPLARRVQQAGTTALSIDFRGYGKSTGPGRRSPEDIIAAVAFLRDHGYTDIALVGASMGGAIVLNALDTGPLPAVKRAILLAPAGGKPIASKDIDKLFIVSEGDGLRPTVERLYNESAQPKAIHRYPGDAHAQHLFDTDHAADLTKRIVAFLTN